MNRRFSFSTPARVIAVLAIIVSMFAIPSGSASAGAPTLQKRLAAAQPDQNADGTFPSGSIVVYEVSIGCNAVSGSNDCNGFELHDLTPSFTDVDGLTAYYEFQAATGAGPGAILDATDPTETVITFPTFAAGTSINVELSYRIPPGITPDNTTTTNTATWGEYDSAGEPTANVVTDTQVVTSRARTSFDVRKTGPSVVNPNTDVTFTVSLCGDSPDDPYYGPLRGTIQGATLTDVIPPGFVLVSAPPDGVEAPPGTVTWSLGDIELGPGDCVDRDITLTYPSVGPLPAPISTVNTVTAGGTYPADSDGNPGSDTHPITIDNPLPGIPSLDKGAGRLYVDLDQTDGPGGGDDGDSFSSYFLRPRNTGQGTIFDAVLTDPIPDRFVVERVSTGTWPTGPTGPGDDGLVEFVVTYSDATSDTFTADGTSDDAFLIPGGKTMVSLAVDYGDLPAGWRQNGGGNRIELYGSFIDPGRSGGAPHDFVNSPVLPVVNTATLAGDVLDPVTGAPGPISVSDSATINIESPQPHVAIFKSVTATGNVAAGGVFPSNDTTATTLTWTVRARNDSSATADYPDPVIVDVLPTLVQNTLGQGGLTAPTGFSVNAPAGVTCPAPPAPPTLPVIGTVGGLPSGDPQLNWACTGDLAPGQDIVITFTTDVEEGTPPQTVVNRDYTTTNALTDTGTERFSVWSGGAANGTWQNDVDDLDGDLSTTDRIRTASAEIEVLDFVFLTSAKLVRGGADAVCDSGALPPTGEDNTVYGTERCTRPGGIVDYEMTVTNDGNTDITNIMVMDIFPAIGDSFVVPNQSTGAVTPRNSAFNTFLTGPVTSPDPNVVVEYSTALQPCRYEDFYGNTSQEVPGCTAPAWSTSPPVPISSARSIRISYLDGGIGNPPATLAIGDAFVLEWPMRAAVAAQTDEVAINAFGWAGQSTSSATRNVAGPPPVDIIVGDLTDYVIGDLVWYDENYDGIQNDTPLDGVPLVPVGLFLDNNGNGVLDVNDLFVQETVTDATPGSEGLYLFSGLPPGDYFVAFAPPSTWAVSPAFQGADPAIDSNGTEDTGFPAALWDPAATNGPLYDDVFVSDMVTLGPSNPVDRTIDLGIWRPDPSIDIEKATNAADPANPTAAEDADSPTGRYIPEGQDVTWSYVVTNTGNTTLQNVVVTDDLGTAAPGDDLSSAAATITCPVTTLAPGASMTCTSTTPVPAITGQYANVADVVGDPVLPAIPWTDSSYDDLVRLDGSPFSDGTGAIIPVTDDDPSHYFGAITTVDIEKSTNLIPADEVNTVPPGPTVPTLAPVTWTYVVTIPAPGNVALADVVVVDDSGTPADTGDDLSTANPGDFTFISGDTDSDGRLDVDETWVYTAAAPSGAILGVYENEADVTGTPVTPNGTPITNVDGSPMTKPVDDDPSHYYGVAFPAIDIEKATNGQDADTPTGPTILAGEDVTWTYVITNTGNVDLRVTGFDDDQVALASTLCAEGALFPVVLDPTDSVTCTVTVADAADFGQYANLADVTGTPLDENGDVITENQTPAGPVPVVAPTDDDPSHYIGNGVPGIDIVKVTEGFVWNPATLSFDPVAPGDDIVVTAGEAVTWTYTVTNTGQFALGSVVVNDDNGTPLDPSDDFVATYVSGDTDTDGLLDVDEIWTYTASAIADRGTYVNIADTIGVATDPDGVAIVDQNGDDPFVDAGGDSTIVADDPSGYIADGGPAIDIEKTTNGFQADDPAGDQTDLDNTVPYVPVGSPVTWQYVITNTGDVDLLVDGFGDDRIVDVSTLCTEGALFPVTLAPTETIICTVLGTATMQPGDLYVNMSDVSGAPVDDNGDPLVDQNGNPVFVDGNGDSTIVDADPSAYFGASSAIDLEKATNGVDADTGTGPFVAVGGRVTWTYVVTNTGNTDLADLVVTDSLEGEVCRIDALAVGASETCEIVLPASTLVGQYTNDSTVVGRPVDQLGNPIIDPTTQLPVPPIGDADPSAYFGASPDIDVEKATNGVDADTGTGPFVPVGNEVEWTYVVENTGNVVLTNVVVTDDVFGEVCVIPVLRVGATDDCSVTAVSDVVGQYENVADVVGTPSFPLDPDGDLTDPGNYEPITDPETEDPVPDVDDDDPSHYYGVDVDVDIEKATDGRDADTAPGPNVITGDVVTWTYVVTNTGQTALIDLVVDDDVTGRICTIPLLLPGDSATCTDTGIAGTNPYVNVGSVTGTPAIPIDPNGDLDDPDNYAPIDVDDPEDTDPSHHTPVPPALLPTTGSESSSPLRLAMMLLVAGLGLVVITRTRRGRRHNA